MGVTVGAGVGIAEAETEDEVPEEGPLPWGAEVMVKPSVVPVAAGSEVVVPEPAVGGEVAAPDVVAQFDKQGMAPVGNEPGEFGAYLKVEIDRWAKVIKEAGIKPE